MKAPGSPSSALQTTNFSSPSARRVKSHFRQVAKPAPPRPRSPETFNSAITALRVLPSSQGLGQRLVAVVADVVLDLLRIDLAAACQHDLGLPAKEIHFLQRGMWRPSARRCVNRSTTRPQPRCSRHEHRAILGADFLVKHVVDHHDGAPRTGPRQPTSRTARSGRQPLPLQLRRQRLLPRDAHRRRCSSPRRQTRISTIPSAASLALLAPAPRHGVPTN